MIFWEWGSSNKSIMGFEIFSKLNKIVHFFPKFDMAVNADSDEKICLRWRDNIINCFSVHIAQLV